MSPANPDTLIGRLIDGRYQVRSLIARGGMATVYVATDLRLERRVAIKIMHDHLAADDAFRERFIREARAAARLAHPNLVNVYDQGEDEGLAYIVMEYVPGITLRDLLHDHHRLTVEQTIDIMDALLAGLQVAHRQGIIHRDIKPENVLLADDGRIKLSDFGLARAATSNTASGSVLLGTIAYLAPELVTKGTADVRSDIYSAGIMMYEMLVGEQPYRGEEPVNIAYRHANDNVPPPSEKQPDLPRELDDLVVWSTERDPEDRPADAGAMLAALRQAERDIAASDGVTAPPVTRLVPTPAEPGTQLLAETHNPATNSGWEQLTTPTDPSTVGEVLGADAVETIREDAAEDSTPAPLAAVRLERINRQKRRSGLVAAFVVTLLVALAGFLGWWQGYGPGSYLAAPAVEGTTQDEAAAQIAAQGFVVGDVTEESSLEIPSGTVMSTSPGPGTRLAPDSVINLVISSGPQILTVPGLSGMTVKDAAAAIETAGFTYDEATNVQQFDESEAGTVLYGTDESGEPLPVTMAEQEPIRLVVSAGPVPDVTGLGQTIAFEELDAAGLVANVAWSDYSSSVPAGVVMSQTPTTDPVRPGDTIDLVTSLGPEMIEIPNVVGATAKSAIGSLESAGFEVSHSVNNDELDTCKVTSQSPSAGTEAERSSTVSFKCTVTIVRSPTETP
ncbi:Stk1 family PASTA domain-containing Ser/Thr kinase [Gulosibacter molinativorax]|uniref:non-specific serine/threonine protein kinase n=1 Tax=Gulosibacter molinativorax TaxID=256821 RepID=A0ABT7C5B4_9MICO|nr:Stk1 family PASTA domain-containing Ser/Thr kinase [Gulosibacter molinativorax]MDJ1370385.1 Stk1 family PASTA domain-containing Ser/Thr kinase [Gulosibacter molinativorax]